MKHEIKTLLEMVIADNQNFIIENGGNVANYLISNAEMAEFGWYFYLTDNEIEQFEKGSDVYKNSVIESIKEFLKINYDYNLATIQKNEIFTAMLELTKEGEPIAVGAEYNGTNPSVFQEFADTNNFNLSLVEEVWKEKEKDLTELWKFYNPEE